MRWSRMPILALLTVLVACVSRAPAVTDVTAAAPRTARVYRLDMADWEAPLCAGAAGWTFQVSRGQWIAFPIGWVAKDEAKARSNWDHITLQPSVDNQPLDLPDELVWRSDRIRFRCPNREIDGVMVGPMVYLPPVIDSRTYQLRMLFNESVHDGWTTFQKGTDLTSRITLSVRN